MQRPGHSFCDRTAGNKVRTNRWDSSRFRANPLYVNNNPAAKSKDRHAACLPQRILI